MVSPEPNTGCWLWTGSAPNGYGQFGFNGKISRAHRVSYTLFKGSIPEGLVLDHLCRQPSCVNPDHLEAVTIRENTLRGLFPQVASALRKKEAVNRTHCKRGHEFTAENIYINKRGARRCRVCTLKRNHKNQAKLNAWKRNSRVEKRARGETLTAKEIGQMNAARFKSMTRCHKGHPYGDTPAIRVKKDGSSFRECQICFQAKQQRRKEKRRRKCAIRSYAFVA